MNKQVEPFASPLAGQIRRFLRLKRARGCRYKEEERMLHDLDRFLARRLPKRDPVMTDEINRAYLARRGNESETTRGNRLSLIREFCKFLALEDPRTSIPPTRYLGIPAPPVCAPGLDPRRRTPVFASVSRFAQRALFTPERNGPWHSPHAPLSQRLEVGRSAVPEPGRRG